PAVDPRARARHRRTRGEDPRRTRGGIAPAGGRAGGAAKLGVADRARQGAWRAVGRARSLDRLRRHAGPSTVALPDDDRTALLAGDAAGNASSRVGTAVARGVSSRGSEA